jgi:hypothetical protein
MQMLLETLASSPPGMCQCLVADTKFESSWAPVNNLDCTLLLADPQANITAYSKAQATDLHQSLFNGGYLNDILYLDHT